MSKLGDVRKMYGQDFGIVVTNATANIINNYTTYFGDKKLLSNILLISSPVGSDGNDIKRPSLFATDFNGEPLQLTYSISLNNGLILDDDMNVKLNIDNNTLQTNNNKLFVDTNKLNIIGVNKLGVGKISNENGAVVRSNNIPTETFIDTTNDGILFLTNSFFDWLQEYIFKQINNAIAPLVSSNLSAVIQYNGVNYYSGDNIFLEKNTDFVSIVINYKSYREDDSTEKMRIESSNSVLPIVDLESEVEPEILENSLNNVGNVQLYNYVASTEFSIYPNLNMDEYGNSFDTNYIIYLQSNHWDESNKSIFTFTSKKYDKPFNLEIESKEIIIQNLYNLKNSDNQEDRKYSFNIIRNYFYDNLFPNNNFSKYNISFNLKIYYDSENDGNLLFDKDIFNELSTSNQFNVSFDITDDWFNSLVYESGNAFIKADSFSTKYILLLTITFPNNSIQRFKKETNMTYDLTKTEDILLGTDQDNLSSLKIGNSNLSTTNNNEIYTIDFNSINSLTDNNLNLMMVYELYKKSNSTINELSKDDLTVKCQYSEDGQDTDIQDMYLNNININDVDISSNSNYFNISINSSIPNISNFNHFVYSNDLKFKIMSQKIEGKEKTFTLSFDFDSFIESNILRHPDTNTYMLVQDQNTYSLYISQVEYTNLIKVNDISISGNTTETVNGTTYNVYQFTSNESYVENGNYTLTLEFNNYKHQIQLEVVVISNTTFSTLYS